MIAFKAYLILFNPVFPKLMSTEPFSRSQSAVLQNTLQKRQHKYKQQNGGILLISL